MDRKSSIFFLTSRATWHNIPEDTILHSHCRENLKSYIRMTVLHVLAVSIHLVSIKTSWHSASHFQSNTEAWILTVVSRKGFIFWDITQHSLLKVSQHFRAICCIHLLGWKEKHHKAGYYLLHAGDNTYLQNINWLSTDHVMLYPKRCNS
jgi:hypothetical protein